MPFDFGHDDLRLFLLDQPLERSRIGHRDHVRAMRNLMTRRIGVTINGNRFNTQPLECDDQLLAQLAAAEDHHAGRGRRKRRADLHGSNKSVAKMSF